MTIISRFSRAGLSRDYNRGKHGDGHKPGVKDKTNASTLCDDPCDNANGVNRNLPPYQYLSANLGPQWLSSSFRAQNTTLVGTAQ